MSGSRESIPPDASPALDLSLCEQEPIHIPGAIQPHGAVLAALADGLLVTHASANLAAILGRPAEAVLGRPLAEAVGEAVSRALQGTGLRDGTALSEVHSLPGPDGGLLHLNAHRSGLRICVDIEPRHPEPWQTPPVTVAQSVLETFKYATTPGELCELAVRGLRAITGYDRVMAYRFGADGHGEVIAEARAAPLESYLGLHYPATDIPPQARRQYLRQRVGAIVDSSYQPVPLLTDPGLDDGTPLDLTHSTLRSASPIHREYMRNMKTAASLTIGLAHGHSLWGMLVCHHATPRVAGPDLRAVADMIGQVVSLLLVSLGEADLYAQRHQRQATLRALADRLAAPVPLAEALTGAEAELLRLVDAAGVVVSFSGAFRCLGRTPPLAAAERAFAALQLAAGGQLLAVDDLGLRYPALAGCTSEGSGALLLPLTQGTDDAILWFRPEVARTVTWGGNPAEHATLEPATGRLSPRTSFVLWKETVRGRAVPWAEVDLALAGDLRGAVEAEVARRTKAELTQLRRFDSLSGQPNRQRDLERSNADLEEFAYAASHDLKAPLRAIGHLAQWIGEDLGAAANPDTVENLRMLQGRVARLQLLLDGLLAYSRVGRHTDAPVEDVDIAALVQDITAMLAPPPGFTVACEGEMPVIRTHRAPITVVLTNLIGNGVKHHDRSEGRITVAMRLQDGVAEFRVSDDGPGIAPRFHDRIFVIFQTLASRDDVESSGIGLAIVKKKVQAHGGRIWVESAPPARGSVFVFTWNEAIP